MTLNPLPAEISYKKFLPLEVVSRYHNPHLQCYKLFKDMECAVLSMVLHTIKNLITLNPLPAELSAHTYSEPNCLKL